VEALELVKVINKSAQDKKASKIFIQDLSKQSDLCDYQFICSADSDRHARALCETIVDQISVKLQQKPFAIEGAQAGQWVLIDYGNVLVHVFYAMIRDFYALEQLWPDAPILDTNNLDAVAEQKSES
jgi:ribosome-associated protein